MQAAPIRVLVVDDDEDDYIILKEQLGAVRGTRFVLEWVAEARTALARMRERAHDVYLLDYLLGNDSGLDLARAAIADGVTAPILMLTGQGSEDVDASALEAGVSEYLVKGRFDGEALSRAIRYAIGRARDRAELAESAARYRELFRSNPAPVMVYALDDLRFLAVNDAAVAQYGWSESEFLAMTLLDIRPPEDRPRILDLVRSLQQSDRFAGESRHLRRDGSLIQVAVTSHGLEWDGKPARLALVLDITEQRRAERALRDSEVQLRLLLADVSDALLVVDAEGSVQFVNPAAERLLGIAESDVRGLRPPLPEPLEDDAELQLTTLAGLRTVEAHVADTRWRGEPARILALRDITERRRIEARARLLERAVEASTNAVVIVDARQFDQPIIYVNAAFERITGWQAADAVGRNCRFLQADDRGQAEIAELREAIAAERDCEVILRNYRRDGTLFWNQLTVSPVRDGAGRVTHFIGVQNDLTERRRYEAEIAYHATHDAVTGLPRLAVLLDHVRATIAAAEPTTRIALLHVDLDRFGTVNESMGHAIGDQALRQAGERLRALLEGRGRLARVAADEFLVAVVDQGATCPLQLAEALRRGMELPLELAPYRLHVTATIGVARWPQHAGSAEELLHYAEAAMTRGKRAGRNMVVEFTREHAAEIQDRLALGGRLRDAIRDGEFQLHFQPQVSAHDGRVVGMEALVRWQTRDQGMVPPGRFIRVAEELGIIVDLGRWVLESACQQARAWRDEGHEDVAIAVNVSALQLQRPTFVDEVREALEGWSVPPTMIEIELTESAIMENVDRMAETMRALKALGVRIALDDFGIGYSSLNYLKRFPIDKLKIDQSFVQDITAESGQAAIARAIIAMGHQLHMRVMAEGVETEAQLGYLRRNHCDEFQGYFFSAPLRPDEASALLSRRYLARDAFAATRPDQTLLLLDDEENILRALVRLLRRDGYRIHTAGSVQEAFDILGRHEVHVIVSDQRMPDMNGTEFLSRVKDMYPDTVRLVLSGYTDLGTLTEAINRGAIYKFLTKPWDDEELRRQIQEAFRTWAVRRREGADAPPVA